jgi:hypothetical protein
VHDIEYDAERECEGEGESEWEAVDVTEVVNVIELDVEGVDEIV